MKRDFAFVEFSDYRDADDARCDLDGREFIGSRIVVEFAKGVPRGHGGSRDYMAKGGPPPGTGRCFNCGLDGHWARDCDNGDWKNKCYRCGERGHIERNCQNSPKKLKRGCSYSRSPSPRRGRSPSPRRGRSPLPNRGRSPRRSPRRRDSRSLSYSRSRSYSHSLSPTPHNRSPKRHRTSPRPYDRSPSVRESPSPRARREDNGSDYSISPRRRSRSPVDDADRDSPRDRTYRDPVEENGRSPSPSPIPSPIPRADRPRSDDDDGGYTRGSPGGSDSA